METVNLHLGRYGRKDERFLSSIITLEETWFQYHQPKLKRQSNEWRHNDSPRSKKYRQEQDSFKVMFIVAYGFDCDLVTHSVPAGNRVNGAYCNYFLEHLRSAVRAVKVQISGILILLCYTMEHALT